MKEGGEKSFMRGELETEAEKGPEVESEGGAAERGGTGAEKEIAAEIESKIQVETEEIKVKTEAEMTNRIAEGIEKVMESEKEIGKEIKAEVQVETETGIVKTTVIKVAAVAAVIFEAVGAAGAGAVVEIV